MKRSVGAAVIAAVMAVGMVESASAAMAVVDVRAIAQLRQQLSLARDQLATLRDELNQLRATHAALTGPRGMQHLLAVAPEARNYLPEDWAEMQRVLAGQSARYGALAAAVSAAIESQQVLSPGFVAGRSPDEQAVIEAGRQGPAWLASLTREAYAQASARFGELQQLIGAVGQVTDAKAAADLQARIASEQAMLANEQAKLELLAMMAQAEQGLAAQRVREAAIAGHGTFAARFQPVLP